MNEHAEHPAALTDIPMLTEYDEELSAPVTVIDSDGEPFGVYSAAELRFSRASQRRLFE